jgi:Flp pilus assembly pilin Flp
MRPLFSFLASLRRFVREENGLETVEWAIVGGLVVAVSAALFFTMGSDVSVVMTNLQSHTAAAAAS